MLFPSRKNSFLAILMSILAMLAGFPVKLYSQESISKTISVDAKNGWIQSDISVEKGCRLVITASGKWSNGLYTDGKRTFRPFVTADGGNPNESRRFSYPLPTASVGALIAKVGNSGKPFVLGSSFSSSGFPNSGTLYFSINDDFSSLADNLGQVRVNINKTCPSWEVWLVARAPDGGIERYFYADPGHAFIAIVKNYGEGWQLDTTFGYWPESNSFSNTGKPIIMKKEDRENAESIIANGSNFQVISRGGWAVRKSRIPQSNVENIKREAYRGGICSLYVPISTPNLVNNCNCADFATRLWHMWFGDTEDYRMSLISPTLGSLVRRINEKNSKDGGFTN